MAVPNLLHKVRCTIERIDRPSTVYDDDAREPVQHAARHTAVVLDGQPRWYSQEQLTKMGLGAQESSRGYVVFRMVDLDAAGFTPQMNDRITIQGRIVQEVYITRIEPFGHYADQNGASLLKCWVSDRVPSKVRE